MPAPLIDTCAGALDLWENAALHQRGNGIRELLSAFPALIADFRCSSQRTSIVIALSALLLSFTSVKAT